MTNWLIEDRFYHHSSIKDMAIAQLGHGGRHYFVADIDFENDPDLPLWTEFFSVCRRFCYRDIMAVSRAFGVHYNTVNNWKHSIRFPSRRGTAVLIIQWAKNGKPMRKVQPGTEPIGMF